MHGSDGDVAEPDLVPLLDVVLQLIMFFIISANFVMEELNDTIKLPEATAAKSLDAQAENILFVNVNEDGEVLVTNDQPRTTPAQIQVWFDQMYQLEQARLRGKDVDTIIVIRGDASANFEDIYSVMMAAKKAKDTEGNQKGFKKVHLRATIEG